MEATTSTKAEAVGLIPLERETRAGLDTETAARHLNRQPNTLRQWASQGTCPEELTPRRVAGRLLWPVEGLRKLCGVGQ